MPECIAKLASLKEERDKLSRSILSIENFVETLPAFLGVIFIYSSIAIFPEFKMYPLSITLLSIASGIYTAMAIGNIFSLTILFSAIIGAGVSVFFFESQGVPRSDFTLHWAFLGGLISAVSSIATVVFIYFAPFGVAGKKRESLRALNSEISTLEKDKGVK